MAGKSLFYCEGITKISDALTSVLLRAIGLEIITLISSRQPIKLLSLIPINPIAWSIIPNRLRDLGVVHAVNLINGID